MKFVILYLGIGGKQMRKSWIIWVAALAFVLLLSACSDDDNEIPGDAKEKDNQIESKKQKEKTESEEDATDADKEEDPETSMDKQESKKGDKDSEADEKSDDEAEEDDDFSFDTLFELGFDIFEAQVEEDYDFLESVLSEGSSVNKEENTFQFDNVTYPHEYEFITEKDFRFLDERYANGNEKEGVMVGYEVTDFETESSYVIDTEFIKEDGKWKLNDMDVNK